IREEEPEPGRIGFAGHWGFQYYAERAGMTMVAADRTLLHRGDWLVLPHGYLDTQRVSYPGNRIVPVAQITCDDRIPFGLQGFYSGGVPLAHHNGPRLVFWIFRVVADCVPVIQYTPEQLVQWAASRNRPVPPAAITAVVRAINQLGQNGAPSATALPWLQKLNNNSDTSLRMAARHAMALFEAKPGDR